MAELLHVARKALELVRSRRRDAHRAVADALEGITVVLAVPLEGSLLLRASGGELAEIDVAERGARIVRISTDRAAVRSLATGATTLTRSLRAGHVDLTGTVEALARVADGFELFVGALLRIDEAPELLREMDE